MAAHNAGMDGNMRQLMDLAKLRSDVQAAWYRQILTLAAGGLALLVALVPAVPKEGPARYFLAAAWILLGLGILAGASATYAEVSLIKRLAAKFQFQVQQSLRNGTNLADHLPLVAQPATIFLWSKPLMVICLMGAVGCLVTFAVLRTLGS
jgi:hypothetical protein